MNARSGSLLRSFLALLGSFLKHLWVPGSTLGALWAHFLNQTSVWGSKGAPRGATPEIKSPFWTHCGPRKSQKSDQNHFLRGSRNGSKNRPTFREPKSEILLLFTTLEQGQTSQKWTPFWELFEDQFCTKYEKMRKRRMPKNRCRKKVTLRKN